MAKSLGNIIVVTTTGATSTSIDGYFRYLALVDAFENADLVTGQTFSSNGYEEYETLDALAVKFPVASNIYKWASDAFAQKVNNDINNSNFEKIVVIQKKNTDASYQAALNRVGYEDAYWILPLTDTIADVQSVYDWAKTKYMQVMIQDNSATILDAGDDTDLASVLGVTATRAAVWYHSDATEGLTSSMAAIFASLNPGDKAGFYKSPSGITVDTITDAGLASLDAKKCNYFTYLKGTAGTWNEDNLTFNGQLLNGDKIQKTLQNDRIVITLQTRGKDVFKQDIPYDNRGVAILEGALKEELEAFKLQEIIKDQYFENADGNLVNGYHVKVYDTATTRTSFPNQYGAQTFVTEIEYLLALTGEKVNINIEYQL